MKYLFLVLFLLATKLHANTFIEKAEKDEVIVTESEDKDMLIAYKKARDTLSDFIGKYEKQNDEKRNYYLKVGVSDEGHVEYFWIANFQIRDAGRFSGVVTNNPAVVKNVRRGDRITFDTSDVYDWMYMKNRKMYGNFTGCAMLTKESKSEQEAFKNKYGLECEVLQGM